MPGAPRSLAGERTSFRADRRERDDLNEHHDLPLILVEDGRVIEKNLRKERTTSQELAAEARIQQIKSLDKVRWAVLESGGRISFIPK